MARMYVEWSHVNQVRNRALGCSMDCMDEQHVNVTCMQAIDGLTASLPHCLTASLPPASLPHCLTASLLHCLTFKQSHLRSQHHVHRQTMHVHHRERLHWHMYNNDNTCSRTRRKVTSTLHCSHGVHGSCWRLLPQLPLRL